MKIRNILMAFAAGGALLMIQPVWGKDAPAKKAPRAVIPEAKHVFSPVLEGLEVKHRFKILNKGSATLKIFNVRTG